MHKHAKRRAPPRDHQTTESKPRSVPPAAYIQAYEAQLIYGQEGRAEELYSKAAGGRGLMRWQGYGDDGKEVWADRHDIIHLLTELLPSNPRHENAPSPTPSSSSSWDSLPSDLVETFHLSDPEDIEEHERAKRTRWMEQLREARLREREEEDREAGLADDQRKGKSKAAVWPENEIPPHNVTTLMSHTAASLLASPNPQMLESRILLNHASDERFDFLKGRWKLTWERTKKDARAKRDIASGKTGKERKVMSGLVGAYDSESDESDLASGIASEGDPPPPPAEDIPPPPSPTQADASDSLQTTATTSVPKPPDDDLLDSAPTHEEVQRQRLRRLKAEEWKRNRASNKST